MNFYEYGKSELTSRGMFEDQAIAVMQKVVEDSQSNSQSVNRTIRDRWTDNIYGYPPMCRNLIYMGIEPIALEYIKENCPEAWFRPMFDKDHPLRKEFEALQK